MQQHNITRAFATALREWPARESAVQDACRLLLIDGLAVAAAGASEAGPTLMAGFVRDQRAEAVSTVIGHGFSTSATTAAQVNGMSMHVLDFEPMWNPPNHAVSPLLPALLALAEQRELEGAGPQGVVLFRAIAKGVEAQGRLRLASGQIEPHGLRFHPPGVVGPLATALACGELIGLDLDKLTMALAISASCGAGIIGNIGSMSKAMHCGNAAMRGLECAQLALRGFTGDADALGGPRGYGNAYFGEAFDPAPLVAPVSTPRVLDPGMSWKLFPSQFATHYTISAALDCRSEIADPGAIKSVVVTTPPMAYVDRPQPATGLAGKFSFQYGVAAALLDGRVDMASFTDVRRFSPGMVAMLSRIKLENDATISGRLDKMHADVAVCLKDGRVIKKRCLAPDGSWSRPVAPERIKTKARGLLNESLSADDAARFWRWVEAEPAKLKVAELMSSVRNTLNVRPS